MKKFTMNTTERSPFPPAKSFNRRRRTSGETACRQGRDVTPTRDSGKLKKHFLLSALAIVLFTLAHAQPELQWYKLDMSQNPATSDLMPCKLQVDPAGNIDRKSVV